MPNKFERDFDKYIVIKVSDLKLAANCGYDSIRPEDIQALHRIRAQIANVRFHRGKPTELVTVVVEHDWPEYEPTWKAIEMRCTTSVNYPDWLRRLIAEAATLDDNRTKLLDAIQANKVPKTEVQILTEQWECMTHLSVILHSRISRGVDVVLGHVRD